MESVPTDSSIIQYQSDILAYQIDNDPEESYFRYTFTEKSYLLGAPRAVMFMSCEDADDLDVFFQLRKEDASGQVLRYYNIPEKDMLANGLAQKDVPLLNTLVYLGPHGQIRASHRKIDEKLSTPHFIRHEHRVEEKVEPGVVVRIETSIWPGGMIFEKGESLVLKVAGHPMFLAEFPTMRGQFKARNTGKHNIHVGGDQASQVILPFVQFEE